MGCLIFRQLHIVDYTLNFYVTWQKHKVISILKISTHIWAQSFADLGQMIECSFMDKIIVGSRLIAVTQTSDFAPASRNQMLNIERGKDCGFNLKFVHDMTKTYSQMHSKDKYSHLSSIIWWLWSNVLVFAYVLNSCSLETNSSYLKFRFCSCLEKRDGRH